MKNIWYITQESRGILKVGGLGEVIYNLAVQLKRSSLDTTIFMPEHGIVKNENNVEKLNIVKISENTSLDLIVYHGKLHDVNIILIGDKSNILSNPVVYGEAITDKKVSKITANISWILDEVFKNGFEGPDIIHVNDWHGVPIGLGIKEKLEKQGEKLGSLLQIHLLIGKYVSSEYLFNNCRLDPNHLYSITENGSEKRLSLFDVYNLSNGVLEKIGAYIFDRIATVSEAYLKRDDGCILCSLGWNFERKSIYIYNGTDWEYNEILSRILDKYWNEIKLFTDKNRKKEITREDLRRYLLLYALENLPENEPIIKDEYLKDIVFSLRGNIIKEKGRPYGFKSDGLLIITTGRASFQKGFDILLKAIPEIIDLFPESRFIFFLLPIRGEEHLIREIFEEANRYPDNVRVVYGIAGSVYQMAHISADVFVAPSRWEPFGIMAIEALATGNPVVASKVGGLSEIVIDLRHDTNKGVGLLVEKNNYKDLANALKSLLFLKKGVSKKSFLLDKIDIKYHKMVLELIDVKGFYEILRQRCIKRVETSFRWNNVSKMALKIYKEILSEK